MFILSKNRLMFLSLKPRQLSMSLFVLSLSLLLVVGSSVPSDNQIEADKKSTLNDDDQNVLKKHVSFFDRNNDGIIYPWETFQGFRAIGASVPLSTVAALFINSGLSPKTRPGKSPSPLIPIEVEHITLSKHTSDSGVYDTEGRFVPEKFEEIFQKHAHTNATYLTSDELSAMLKANRAPKDFAGWVASMSEWKILYLLCKDENGLLQKETIRAVYDGSLFEQMEQQHRKKA